MSNAPALVVVIDDDESIAPVYDYALESYECERRYFRTCEDALKFLSSSRVPKLIITDHSLSTLTSEELLDSIFRLREDIAQGSFILGISGMSRYSPSLADFKNRVNAFEEKPMDLEPLVELLKKYMDSLEIDPKG